MLKFPLIVVACLSGWTNLLLAADIIPSARRIAWDPGIPGGIPARAAVATTLAAIDASGATDVTAQIQAALDHCPADQVVALPAGTFRIDGHLVMPSHVTLRGAGRSTVLSSRGSGPGLILFGASGIPWDPTPISTGITAGVAAGATSMTVASTSGIATGTYLVVTELNDPAFVSIGGTANGPATWVDSWSTGGTRARGQIVEVTGVSGGTVGFKPGLYSAYTRTPWATRFTAQCSWSGVEDLRIYANDTGSDRNLLFQCAAYCWARNVEGDYTDGDHCTLDWSYRCEIRHCHFHDAYIHTAGNLDNMIGLRSKSSACLVIDNIIRRLHMSVMCEWGASGNVIAYNFHDGDFDQNVATGARFLAGGLDGNHGAHPQFNLFEGNIARKIFADAYWGSSSDTTIFRNYVSGTGVAHPPYAGRGVEDLSTTALLTQADRAIDLWELQSRYNVVGNVVGDASLIPRGVVRRAVSPGARGYDDPPCCFSYGYTTESDGGGPALANPTATLIEHGNWDVASGGTVWDPGIAERTIPDSLFLSAKPAWFGNLAWPPIDPGRPAGITPSSIPAGYRFVHGSDPPGDAGSPPSTTTGAAAPAGSSGCGFGTGLALLLALAGWRRMRA